MPSDSVKLPCIYCGRKRTLRVRAGLWWKCKGCGKRNPGTTMLADLARQAIDAGRVVVGKRSSKNVAPAGDDDRQKKKAPQQSPAASSAAGTTVGRRATAALARPPAKKPTKVAPPLEPPAKASETTSPSFARRALGVLKEAIV